MLFYVLLSITIVVSIFIGFKWRDVEMFASALFFGTVASMLLTAIAAILMFSHAPDTYTLKTTVDSPIVSLNTGSQLNGSFFLGCGTIGSEEHYVFMRDLGNKHYLRDSYPAKSAVIVETTDKPSFTYDVIIRNNHPRWKWISPDSFRDDGTEGKANYRINVPPGTIIQRFEVK